MLIIILKGMHRPCCSRKCTKLQRRRSRTSLVIVPSR